jgi:23S rRNA pseudouridine1911/1915/1917 synthase
MFGCFEGRDFIFKKILFSFIVSHMTKKISRNKNNTKKTSWVERFTPGPSFVEEFSANILYEDNHLLGIYKPAGLLVQGDRSGRATLLDMAKYWLKLKYEKPGDVFLGLVHRLDRPVAGVIMFARTSKAAGRLSAQFRDHSVTKIYRAVVHGHMSPPQGILKGMLVKQGTKTVVVDTENQGSQYETVEKRDIFLSGKKGKNFNRRNTSGISRIKICRLTPHHEKMAVSQGSQYAELSYTTVETKGEFSLLQIQLVTGRRHQIRAQLAAEGHPIVGDTIYGSPFKFEGNIIALLARSLTCRHPTKPVDVTIDAPLPPDWPWPPEKIAN